MKFNLKLRGVFVSSLQKQQQQLIHKCIKAQTFIIATDPDGLLDNGHKNTKKKPLTHDDSSFVKITNVLWIMHGLIK